MSAELHKKRNFYLLLNNFTVFLIVFQYCIIIIWNVAYIFNCKCENLNEWIDGCCIFSYNYVQNGLKLDIDVEHTLEEHRLLIVFFIGADSGFYRKFCWGNDY